MTPTLGGGQGSSIRLMRITRPETLRSVEGKPRVFRALRMAVGEQADGVVFYSVWRSLTVGIEDV